MASNVNLSRSAALNLTTDLAQAGATFNDATRLLDGGGFQFTTPADVAGQQNFYGSFIADIHAVLNDVSGDLALGAGGQITVGGNAYTLTATDIAALTSVQTSLNDMITQAPNAVGTTGTAVAAQAALHADQASITHAIAQDTGLATALANASFTGNEGATDVGFQQTVVGSDNAAALNAATTAGASLATIGAVFNAAENVSEGGLNTSNLAEFTNDIHAVATGVQNILNSPTQLAAIEAGETANAAALTTIHLQTVENQLQWQLGHVAQEFAANPSTAARDTSDNLLDIIDIVQNDANLNMNAGGNGTAAATGGFAELPGFLTGTVTQFQDNQAQTNFWAQFISEANTINNQLTAEAKGTGTVTVASLITEIQNYQQFGASFANSQTGEPVFEDRFGNELTQGTLLADTNAAVQGLTGIMNGDTGAKLAADQAEINAAGHGFVADANDVSGNNIPLGGGHFVGTSTTVAGATSVAGLAQGTIPVGPVADGATGLSSGAVPLVSTTPGGPGGPPAAGGSLLTDFAAFAHGTGSAQTVLSDLSALVGGQNNLTTLLTALEQAAGGPGGAPGPGGPGGHGPEPAAAPVDHSHTWHW
jgi:trimeric autotransporter adhesin